MVEIEQTAQSLPFLDTSGLVRCFSGGKGDDIVDPLMRTFGMVVGDVFVENVFQRVFSEKDHLVQAFAFDGANPAFGERVEIRAAGWQD